MGKVFKVINACFCVMTKIRFLVLVHNFQDFCHVHFWGRGFLYERNALIIQQLPPLFFGSSFLSSILPLEFEVSNPSLCVCVFLLKSIFSFLNTRV